MSDVLLTGAGISVDNVTAVARDGARLLATPETIARLTDARGVLERAAARGDRIYGFNTGLGSNLGTAVTADFAAFQLQVIRGRGVAVGEPLSRQESRAVLATRLAMFATGGSGVSPEVFIALSALLDAGVHPVLPSIGSIGAGDLVLLSALARALVGEGEAEFAGERLPAREALARAGLAPVRLGPKDGIALLNASAVSVGLGALALHDAARLLDRQRQAAALSFEGLAGNPAILAPAIQAARPSGGQAHEAAILAEALAGSSLHDGGNALQDPLSLRCVASIDGVLAVALGRAREAVEIELAAAADNPLVIVAEERVLSTGNFHTPEIALAFETLSLALAQAAAACAARFVQLTGSGRSGLPRFLSPVGGASAGFVPMQKTVTALLAAIRHDALPVLLDGLPVSEGVEDVATQSMAAVAKVRRQLEAWRWLLACEFLAAAQAVDLRPGHRLGAGTRSSHAFVRRLAPMLEQDRPLGEDVAALFAALDPAGADGDER